jgi:N-acetylmuramoyl-L-alanine amidase
MAKKIYLSPSEQPDNKYAYGNTNEKDQCRKIAAVVEKSLKRHGFEVINATANDLSDRCAEANKWGANLYVPIHTNAHNKKVSGTRIFCYRTDGEGYKACKAIYNVLAPITPGKSENVTAQPGLYEVRPRKHLLRISRLTSTMFPTLPSGSSNTPRKLVRQSPRASAITMA